MTEAPVMRRGDAKRRAVLVAANIFHRALAETGGVSINQIVSAGQVSYKTVKKDIVAGLLPAEERVVGGKRMWVIARADAERYLARLPERLDRARREKKSRPRDVQARPGHVTVKTLIALTGRSKWFVYDCIKDGRLKASPTGRHGAYEVAREEADRFWALYRDGADSDYARRRFTPKTKRGRAAPRKHQYAIVISDPLLLVWILLDQPDCSLSFLAGSVGSSLATVKKWAEGAARPTDNQIARVGAFARGRYKIKVSDELAELGAARRRDYMRLYMRIRREGDAE